MLDDMMAHIEARAKHFGPMRDANGYAKKRGDCGDLAEVWLRIDGGRIRKASFMTDGCGWSSHCCNAAVSMIEGRKPETAAKLTQEEVLEAAGSVPPDHQHCALLAAETVGLAIKVFQNPSPKISIGSRLKTLFHRENKNA